MLKKFLSGLLVVLFVYATGGGGALAGEHKLLPMPETGEDGLHIQDWLHDSFLDLSDDLTEAAAQGKRLAIIWEQRGCPYCKRMNEVNLRIPRVVNYIKRNFVVHRFNLWGDRKVTDFDGQVLSEKELANKYGILYTPTLQFFPESLEKVAGRSGKDSEVVRIPGYFKPFHFFFLFHYALEKGYEKEPNFQRWLGGIGAELDEEGIKYDLWSDDLPKGLPEKFL